MLIRLSDMYFHLKMHMYNGYVHFCKVNCNRSRL